jgi:hypothetical protein
VEREAIRRWLVHTLAMQGFEGKNTISRLCDILHGSPNSTVRLIAYAVNSVRESESMWLHRGAFEPVRRHPGKHHQPAHHLARHNGERDPWISVHLLSIRESVIQVQYHHTHNTRASETRACLVPSLSNPAGILAPYFHFLHHLLTSIDIRYNKSPYYRERRARHGRQ